ncbi:MAG: hypothetical protein KDK39_16785, partial [Leptospiraceae bacterium]|nr:hypothetical protein [Leptospiraceae bacterium]
TIGQMIRDAYPYGVRKSLRTSFPKDHKQELDKVHKQLSSLLTEVEIKTHLEAPEKLQTHYQALIKFLNDIIQNDPELSHFV